MAQDIVWEKHNGSGFAADRFKRVHEHAVQFYRADAPWAGVFNEVQRRLAPTPPSAASRAARPAHRRDRAQAGRTEDGGHAHHALGDPDALDAWPGIHPTEKPRRCWRS
jgi:site-specific DNA-methyltransferase (adenine-specific)